MRSDGEFTIKSGGITQNIQIELNLSDNDCKALGSIWQDILDELEDTSNYTVSNNNNKLINKENDYKVFQGAVIKFSEDCWKRIVSKVSTKYLINLKLYDILFLLNICIVQPKQSNLNCSLIMLSSDKASRLKFCQWF